MSNGLIKYSFLILLILFSIVGIGQNADFPEEKVNIQLSQKCLFPGETLWISLFVSNQKDLPGKQISNIAYVEFIDSSNKPLVRKKVKLVNGHGNCSIIVPDSFSTDVCYLMVYTNWLKNFGEGSYCKSKLLVFNPNNPVNESEQKTISEINYLEEDKNEIVKLSSNKTKFSTREKVSFEIDLSSQDIKSANLSITIRQKVPQQILDIVKSGREPEKKTIEKISFMPDYNGVLLSGRLLNKFNNSPISNKEIVLSYLGEYVEIKYATTNDNGEFKFLIDNKEGELDLVFTLPSDECVVKLEDPFLNGFEEIPGAQVLKFEKSTLDYLRNRFVIKQLQQKFGHSDLQDEVNEKSVSNFDFFRDAYQTIHFADYKKLDSISEYFYELIPTVHFSYKQGKHDLFITDPETNFNLGENPAVFVDGVYYPSLKELASIDHNLVDNIKVIPKIYYYRTKIYDGIVSVSTQKKDFNSAELLDNMVRIIYPLTDSSIGFKNKSDETIEAGSEHIPDLRDLLFWKENVEYKDGDSITDFFYTSDITGKFEISLVGISNTGEFFEAKKTIEIVVN